ncbi:MAG: hypothetical protein JFAIHJKO_01767 [Pyrinomonadaceae bacterium]|nr:hypothetical protein [Pyrinomonadaceae bacterium]
MTVRGLDAEFTESPRFVADTMDDIGTAISQFCINFINILDKAVSKVRMVACFVCPKGVEAFAKHYFEVTERQEFPAGRGKVSFESKLVNEIVRRGDKVLYGENVPCMYSFSFHLISISTISN